MLQWLALLGSGLTREDCHFHMLTLTQAQLHQDQKDRKTETLPRQWYLWYIPRRLSPSPRRWWWSGFPLWVSRRIFLETCLFPTEGWWLGGESYRARLPLTNLVKPRGWSKKHWTGCFTARAFYPRQPARARQPKNVGSSHFLRSFSPESLKNQNIRGIFC